MQKLGLVKDILDFAEEYSEQKGGAESLEIEIQTRCTAWPLWLCTLVTKKF